MTANESKLNTLSEEQNPSNYLLSNGIIPEVEENTSSENFAIEFENVSRLYRLHHEPNLTLQDRMLNLFKRKNSYEDFFALKDISFKLEKGRTLGIIGKNGAGKSTLLKLATRILEPTSGAIRVNGRVSAMLELGTGFHPELTARENIYLNGAFYGFNHQQMEERYQRIVEFSELGKFIDTPVKHFSSGMYMRLGFAIAITVSPDILIIDEVLAVGDAAFGRKCHLAIEELRSQSKAMMFVSHAAGEISRFCDEVIYLANGKIAAYGKPGEVLDEYMMDSMGPSYFSLNASVNKLNSTFSESVQETSLAKSIVDHNTSKSKKIPVSPILTNAFRPDTTRYQISNGIIARHLHVSWQFSLNHSQVEEEAKVLPEYYLAIFNPHNQLAKLTLSSYKHSTNSFDQLAGVLHVQPLGQFDVPPLQLCLLQLEEGAVINTNLLNLTSNLIIAVELVEYHVLNRFQSISKPTANRAQPGLQRFFPFCDVRYDNQCYFEIFNPNEELVQVNLHLYRDWAGPVYEVKTFQLEPHSQILIDLKAELAGGEGERYKGEGFYGSVELKATHPIVIERYNLQINSPTHRLLD